MRQSEANLTSPTVKNVKNSSSQFIWQLHLAVVDIQNQVSDLIGGPYLIYDQTINLFLF